jgi:tetratricopeptide (TPR) repeat protein
MAQVSVPSRAIALATIVFSLVFSAAFTRAQSPAPAADRGRILLVLPFDNRTSQPNLEWIREAAAELLSSRFASAGFSPMTRADRVYALDHLGLPPGFQPSRASSLKLAQTLDADSIIVGSYSLEGADIVAEAQVVNVPHLRMSPAVTVRGPMGDMIRLFDTLAWQLTRQLDPSFNVAEATFVAAGNDLRLDAFEQYIRGITEPDQAERLRHLEQAVKLSPDYSPAWMALGREQYNTQQYEQAAEAFARVNSGGPDGLEAGFHRGLSLLFSGDYPAAEKTFAEVARTLPLAEVINNQAVAISRQGHDATSLFVQAAADDPNNADYHFNLAVSLKRHGNTAAALNEVALCLKLRPADSEAQTLQTAWKRPAPAQALKQASMQSTAGSNTAAASADSNTDSGEDSAADPLERIVRTFDAAAFRQAAMMLDQMDAARLAALSPAERAQKLCTQADGYLGRGLVLEAERLYQSAASADPQLAAPHVGLARVRLRASDIEGARSEAQAALTLEPSNAAAQQLIQQIPAHR